MPWRTAFGSGLHLLRHRNADPVLAELARVRARDALRRWAPSAELLRVETTFRNSELRVHVLVGEDSFVLAFPRGDVVGDGGSQKP